MNKQVAAYRQERDAFVALLRKFPTNKRLSPLFGDWSLREILLHLLGWTEYQQRVLAVFKRGGIPEFIAEPDVYNSEQIATRRDWDFDKAFSSYLAATDRLIGAYDTIPEAMWQYQIWPEKSDTPKTLLQIEIDHLKNSHEPQIKAVLAQS